MFGRKPERKFNVYDATNSLSTGHLTSRDPATSEVDPGWILSVQEAVYKRGRLEIAAALVLKGNKIGTQRFKFHTHTFPARRGTTFVVKNAWNANEPTPPF